MGVTPCNVWNARNTFYQHCLSKCTVDWQYSKCCYDADNAAYQAATEKYYVEKFFKEGGCLGLGWPAFYVCGDIAINSGTGRSRQFVGQMGSTCTGYPGGCKAYCTAINEKHRQFYHQAAKRGQNHKFLKGAFDELHCECFMSMCRAVWVLTARSGNAGWLNRAADRDKTCQIATPPAVTGVCVSTPPATGATAPPATTPDPASAQPPAQPATQPQPDPSGATPPAAQPDPNAQPAPQPVTPPADPAAPATPAAQPVNWNLPEADDVVLAGDGPCKARGGKCKYMDRPCEGTYLGHEGNCGGPVQRRCCVPGAAPATVPGGAVAGVHPPVLLIGDGESMGWFGKTLFDTLHRYFPLLVHQFARPGMHMYTCRCASR